MAISLSYDGANLDADELSQIWNQEPNRNQYILISDYIAKGKGFETLFRNDQDLQNQINDLSDEIEGLDARLTIVEGQIVALDARLTQAEADIQALDVRVTQNESDISDNTDAINDINDGRYRPQYGTGSPVGVVTANLNGSYYDLVTAPPEHWQNPTDGDSAGWVLVSSSG